MFEKWKERREERNARNKAIAESQYWREHIQLRHCIRLMQGCCTVAPWDLHEAAVAAANIALLEDTWQLAAELTDIPEDFPPEHVFLVWNDPKLPVLKAPWALAKQYLADVRAVAEQTFLVSEHLDRIIWFDRDSCIRLYSVQ